MKRIHAMLKRTLATNRFVIAFVVLTLASGCSSKSQPRTSAESARTEEGAKTNTSKAQPSSNPGIDLQCVMDRLQNPSESFHYVYKKDSTNPVHQEADVTPQSIDGFRVGSEGQQQPLHG